MQDVFYEVQNNRRNALRRLIEWQPWHRRLVAWLRGIFR